MIKKLFSLLLIFSLLSSNCFAGDWGQTKPPLGVEIDWSNPITKGLVGCWLMNEGGGNRVMDLSGNANHGTLTNMAFPGTASSGWTAGKDGSAIAFDGTNDYVKTPNIALTGSFTFNAWFNADVLSKVLAGNDADVYTYFAYISSATAINVQSDNEGTYKSFTVPTISVGKWYCIGVTRDSGNIVRVYLNGVESTSGGQSITGTFTLNGIGRYYDAVSSGSGDYQWDGLIDNVFVYNNRTFILQEIHQLYIDPYGMFKRTRIALWKAAITVPSERRRIWIE